jgi:hypothetical protein
MMVNNINEEEDDDGPIMISLENGERILAIRDYIEKKEGRRMGFVETLSYMMDEVIEKQNILDELHKKKNKQ